VGSLAGEECVPLDPNAISVSYVNGSWKIVQGQMWLLDFGEKQGAAYRSHALIQKYGFTRQCFVGRPDPSFRYWRR
jgi:hypothetical protein